MENLIQSKLDESSNNSINSNHEEEKNDHS